MSIPTTQYKGHELRAYSQMVFPIYRDPYATGARRFSAVVRISTNLDKDVNAHRYAVPFIGENPMRADDAIDLAMQYGRDIIDGKVQAVSL